MGARVRLRHHVELRIRVHDRVKLSLSDTATAEGDTGLSQAHVHDEGLHFSRRWSSEDAAGRAREIVHAASDVTITPEPGIAQDLGKANVADVGCHSCEASLIYALARDGAGDMCAMPA